MKNITIRAYFPAGRSVEMLDCGKSTEAWILAVGSKTFDDLGTKYICPTERTERELT